MIYVMPHPTDTNPRRPLYQAVPIVGLAEDVPLDVMEEAAPEVSAVEPAIALAIPVDVEEPLVELAAPPHSLPVRVLRSIWLGVVGVFGVGVLLLGLAALAAIPVLNLLSLGYLLEAGGRVARSGRLRDGVIGARLAAWLGLIVLGSQLLTVPAYIVADVAKSAAIIDPGGNAARNWRIGLFVLIAITFAQIAVLSMVFIHVAAGFARGFWRAPRGGIYAETRDAVWDTVMALRLPYYFWLGLRGFIGAFAWLALPISLLAVSRFGQSGGGALLGFFRALLLPLRVPFLPLPPTTPGPTESPPGRVRAVGGAR